MLGPDRMTSMTRHLKLAMQNSSAQSASSNFTVFQNQFDPISDKAKQQNKDTILNAAASQYVRYKDERKLTVKVTQKLP